MDIQMKVGKVTPPTENGTSKIPGIDDAMVIFLALRSPEVNVIGLTTIYDNVYTTLATRNALHLLEVAGRTDIPVAEGSHVSYVVYLLYLCVCRCTTKQALFTTRSGVSLIVLHTNLFIKSKNLYFLYLFGCFYIELPAAKSKPIEGSAAKYLVEQARLYPGEITLVALGPLTNIALAIELDPAFTKNVGQIVLLGDAFLVNGNVNPASEANIFGDPKAADIVFTCGADVLAVGLNVTHQVILTGLTKRLNGTTNRQ
ncbi:putative inosine/uridine-preferring nucleoside hydrolase domain, ribonucleoside hydrolase [Helianthus debilis subsp. tardiflorus]